MKLRQLLPIITIAMTCWTAAAVAQAPSQGGAPQTAEQLDKLLAPIALYPDALVIQIAQCSTSLYQVKQVDAWLKQNPGLKGTAAQDAAAAQGFDSSFVAIVLFPQVLSMLANQPDWTQSLGHAFATQREDVLTSIQRLRQQAHSVGNLQTTEQQSVQTVKTEEGDTVIVIQPTNPQVVYVPQYNPQVVYTQPAPASTTTVSSDDDTAQKVAIGVISFAAGVIVGAAADDDDHHYYYSYGGWGYAKPICYPGGYNDYYEHRENMAKDYYKHRENMAEIRGDNQGQRQDFRTDNTSARQDSRTDNQTNRQDTRSTNQTERQGSRSTAQDQRSTSRGSFEGSSRATREDSGAFSGYQRGASERQASERGQRSTSRSGKSSRR